MIDITQLIPTVVKRLKELPVGHSLDIRPYKRNRSVQITKLGEDSYRVVEDGFFTDEFLSGADKIRRHLKALIGKEFPRSTKVRMYTLAPGEVLEGLKKL